MQDQPAEQSASLPTSDRRALLAGIGGLAAGALLAGAKTAHAGPLDPPPGPVASTPGPEPRIAINAVNTPGSATATFRITQPGSYYLTGNLQAEPGKHGIEVIASPVTLDLNGFDLIGNNASPDFRAIFVLATGSVRIRNGSVLAWASNGIDVGVSSGSVISDIRSNSNLGYGIRGGINTVIRDCLTNNNTSGILVDQGSTVDRCMCSDNSANGIEATNACIISNNHCHLNGRIGDGAGILATGTDNRIESNTCLRADRGIQVTGAGNLITRNTCSGNTTANYSIVANNAVAPIIVATTNTAAINGSSYSGNLGSTDPNANFSY